MTPKDRVALEQMLRTIRDAADTALLMLGPDPNLCPKCGSARIDRISTMGNQDFGLCGNCGHEWPIEPAVEPPDELDRLQEVGD